MTISRTFYCDLCNDMHKHTDANLHGLYWFDGEWTLKDNYNTEHHLCDKCMQNISDLWQKVTADDIG